MLPSPVGSSWKQTRTRRNGVEGKSLWKTCRELEASGVPTPKGGKRWHANTIRRWINSDLYLPHTHEEVAARVSGEVAAGLDEDALFGLWCYGQQRVSKASGKAKREGKRRRSHTAPADEIVAVPVPLGNSSSLSGAPRKWAEAARECIRGNEWVSNASGRVWELSGGILRCGHCGRAMTLHTVGKHRYHYYFCPGRRDKLGCENRHHRAERLEAAVVAYVDGELLADRETLERQIDETIAQHQAPSLFRDPDGRARALTKALTDYEAERAGYVRQAARDRITDAELDGFLAEVDARKNAAVEELAKIREAEATAQEAEVTKRAILDMYGTGLQNGVYWFPPVLRRAVYAALGLRVEVFGDRTVRAEGIFDANLMRLIPEVEAYAEGLREIDEGIADAPPEDTRERIDRIERELAALRDRFLCEGAPTPRGG